MNNAKIVIGVITAIIIIGALTFFINNKNTKEKIILKEAEGITVVPTMNDTITSDSMWCRNISISME